MVPTFTKEIWKPNCLCYKFTSSQRRTSQLQNVRYLEYGTHDASCFSAHWNFEILSFMLWESRESVGWRPQAEGESGVLPASAKPVSLQNTEMVPGTRSSSTELQLLSADLLPLGIALQLLQLAQLLCPKKQKAE